MIARLKGILAEKKPTEVLLDVGGVGYTLSIPLSTFEKLPPAGETVVLLTHLHVREDILQLFGFATAGERDLFRLLLSVSGIGPKMAQGILSGLSAAELQEAVLAGDLVALTGISGVGRKTAERIVLELKHKLGKLELRESSSGAPPTTSHQMKDRAEAIVALMSLGYARAAAEAALRTVAAEAGGRDLTVEEMIKRALHHASRT